MVFPKPRPHIPVRTADEHVRESEANLRVLLGCPGPHSFLPKGPERYRLEYLTCTKCGGRLRPVDAMWYERGYADGRKFEEGLHPKPLPDPPLESELPIEQPPPLKSLRRKRMPIIV